MLPARHHKREETTVNPAFKSGIAIIIGIVLSALTIFVGTQALSPAANQSDAPLIEYGTS